MSEQNEQSTWHVVFTSTDAVELARVAEHLAAADIDARVVQADVDDPDRSDDTGLPDDTGPPDEAGLLDDTDQTDETDAGPHLHVVVAADDAHQAAVEVGLFLAVSQSQQHAGRVDLFDELDIEVDDLHIAELTATGGPIYDLDDFDDVDDLRAWLDMLDANGIRWALSREANVVVHYNDEAKLDAIIERMSADDDLAADEGVGAGQRRDPQVPRHHELPEPAPASGRRSRTVHDLDGRPAVDDLTSAVQPIVTKGSPVWLIFAVMAVLLVAFIVFVA